jgi:zinc transport system ATP-binding protein
MLLDINNVTLGYPNKREVLKNVNLTVYEDDFLGIIGPNGGGKTTLVKAIMGLLKPQKGKITFYNKNIPIKHIKIGYLPQINKIDRQFPISVYEVIASGLASGRNILGWRRKKDEQIRTIADKIGVNALLRRPIGTLSGGQLQRTLLGRAIIDTPHLLILDEPATYIDKHFEMNLYALLKEINQQTAIVLVSHDIGTILPLIKNVACVNQTLHYHEGSQVDYEWIAKHYCDCPIEILAHGSFPHRVLVNHDDAASTPTSK